MVQRAAAGLGAWKNVVVIDLKAMLPPHTALLEIVLVPAVLLRHEHQEKEME